MNQDAFPQPPVDMVMPETAQVVATASLATVAGLMFIAALVYWKRHGTPLFVIGMIGGLIACVNEPFTNVVGMCFHPIIGQWEVVEAFGRPIPVWAVLCYPVYFGGLSCLMLLWLRRGITRRRFWTGVAIVMAGNGAFEFPILAADVYLYYGEQPYKFLGMQPTFFVINVLGAVLGALALALFENYLKGWRAGLMLLIPGLGQVAAYGIAAPHIYTLNTNFPMEVKYIGTTMTIAIGLLILNQLSHYAARRFPAEGVGVTEPAPRVAAPGVVGAR